MTWLKRFFLFGITNVLVIVTLSFLLRLLGIGPYLTRSGIQYDTLMAFCLVWGMGGAIVSLVLSRVMAKAMLGVVCIDPETSDPQQRYLLRTVRWLAEQAGLSTMPEVGIYHANEINAFATGPTRHHALVAVSSGLLQRMSHEEIEGVLGHELSHIANGDMVTMTLLQGVVNAFAMFLSRALAFALAQGMRSSDDEERSASPWMVYMLQMILEITFMILGSLVVAWFSRYREYRADAGGAKLAGRHAMIQALEGLRRHVAEPMGTAHGAVDTLKIAGHPRGMLALFASHPSLESRIARLQGG